MLGFGFGLANLVRTAQGLGAHRGELLTQLRRHRVACGLYRILPLPRVGGAVPADGDGRVVGVGGGRGQGALERACRWGWG